MSENSDNTTPVPTGVEEAVPNPAIPVVASPNSVGLRREALKLASRNASASATTEQILESAKKYEAYINGQESA